MRTPDAPTPPGPSTAAVHTYHHHHHHLLELHVHQRPAMISTPLVLYWRALIAVATRWSDSESPTEYTYLFAGRVTSGLEACKDGSPEVIST